MLVVLLIAVACGLVGAVYFASFWACVKARGGVADLLSAVLALLAVGYFGVASIWIPTPVTWVRDSGPLRNDGEVLVFALAAVAIAVLGTLVLKRVGYVAWLGHRVSSSED